MAPKKRHALTLLAAATLALAGCSTSDSAKNEDNTGEKPLIVAMELAYPPFETKTEEGVPTGVSVSFMEDFAEAYDYDLTIENTSFDGLIPMLTSGKADAVMSSMTITEERQEAVDFSEPYASAQLAILAGADSGVESIEDLDEPGRVVAVKTGSTGDVYATKNLPEAQIVRLADESACVTEVIQGKADGFLYDQLTIYRNQQSNPDTTEAVFIPFQDPEFWGVAVDKENPELLEEINEFIDSYREEGGFDKLSKEYLEEEQQAFQDLGFTWFFDLE